MTTIELVRHAEAHDRERWWGTPDRQRPLTETGRAQAGALAEVLAAGEPVATLHSSPYLRCRQTLEPLARMIGRPIADEEALAEAVMLPPFLAEDLWPVPAWLAGRAAALVDRLIATQSAGRLVLCTHGDVVPALIALLAGRDGVAVDALRLAKGGRFVLRFDGRRCVGVTAEPPPALSPNP